MTRSDLNAHCLV